MRQGAKKENRRKQLTCFLASDGTGDFFCLSLSVDVCICLCLCLCVSVCVLLASFSLFLSLFLSLHSFSSFSPGQMLHSLSLPSTAVSKLRVCASCYILLSSSCSSVKEEKSSIHQLTHRWLDLCVCVYVYVCVLCVLCVV